jgi:AAA+ superfamily predicted ATPase
MHAAEIDAFMRLWQREAILAARALLIEATERENREPQRDAVLARLLEELRVVLIVSSESRHGTLQRGLVTLEVTKPTRAEQRALWQEQLGEAGGELNGRLDAIGSQFTFSGGAIRSAGTEARSAARSDESLGTVLWDVCRAQARPRMNDLAQRIIATARWDDLVLPELQKQTLRQIAAQVRHRSTVYEKWGFGAGGNRGLGINALFAGPSGTGKTMAGEVLANELNLDLYRIDLSQVVSKYIGETEKNLRRVFDAAEEGGAILLFDEADALFGKRSEVKDSHDRYANIEISYLLQRMEAYCGLAILTTNMKSALDTAFLRRLRFVVQFPFPDAAQRAEVWQRIFPPQTPTEGLDAHQLARLQVAGGNIRNMALNAAFLAAETNQPVGMSHILQAAKSEYAKLERPLAEAEIGGWR